MNGNDEPKRLYGFRRLTKGERGTFYQELKTPHWWSGSDAKAADKGWPHIYEKGKWKCVYCDTDLLASADILAGSTEEHLVPRSLLEAVEESPNKLSNLAPCCLRCNNIKGEYVPDSSNLVAWQSKNSYIQACREFIARRRVELYEKYEGIIRAALRKRAGLSSKA